jgi:cytochrome c oxidase subunit 2
MQSILSTHGPAAVAIADLAWVLFAGGAAIFLLVLILSVHAIVAPRAWLASKAFIVGGGIVFPVIVLSALLAYVFGSGALGPSEAHAAPLKIEVVGEQWWWRVRYLDASGGTDFVTANEIRIPAGRPVELSLGSADVIHSFWVPNLAGKVDMIPGRSTRLQLAADRPGVYRGQCAEYCGGPHAKMAFYVIAEVPEHFEAWRDHQRRPAASSNALFAARCATCHTVRGTSAAGVRGPDLTHLASRGTLGAATLHMNAGTLAAWIVSGQHHKPGNLMPEFKEFTPQELKALAAYLESLK